MTRYYHVTTPSALAEIMQDGHLRRGSYITASPLVARMEKLWREDSVILEIYAPPRNSAVKDPEWGNMDAFICNVPCKVMRILG